MKTLYLRTVLHRRGQLAKRAISLAFFLAGLWDAWVDQAMGEVVESYTMFTPTAIL